MQVEGVTVDWLILQCWVPVPLCYKRETKKTQTNKTFPHAYIPYRIKMWSTLVASMNQISNSPAYEQLSDSTAPWQNDPNRNRVTVTSRVQAAVIAICKQHLVSQARLIALSSTVCLYSWESVVFFPLSLFFFPRIFCKDHCVGVFLHVFEENSIEQNVYEHAKFLKNDILKFVERTYHVYCRWWYVILFDCNPFKSLFLAKYI